MWLTRISVGNPYFAAVLMLLTVVLGLFAYKKLPIEAFPDVRFPVAVVSTTYTGASPEVVESDISKPLEEAINTINGIKHIRSYSFEGSSVVVVEFELSVNVSEAVQDVRDKVGMVSGGFRREIDTPVVSQFNPTDSPTLSLSLSAPTTNPVELTSWIDNVLKKRLQTVIGVGEVEVVGGSVREIQVALNAQKLEALNLSVTDVSQAIANANRDYPAGNVTTSNNELTVRVAGKLKSAEDFANIIIKSQKDGVVQLKDIAIVTDSEAEKTNLALLNGEPAISINVKASRGANIINVADGVKAEIEALRPQAPPDLKIRYTYDLSQDIRSSVKDVSSTLIEGIFLTVAIVFLFLGTWRSTVITGLTLPISLIGTLFALEVMGFTINLMTLMAMSLSIGLLIDDAIVVRENIVRHTNMGKGHYQSALDGTLEIGLAVLATTLCVVAVFLPVGFMDGIIGQFFHQFGLTVAVAVMISLVVSFSLDPMLSSIWHDPTTQKKRGFLGKQVDKFDAWLERVAVNYTKLIHWSLHHRIKVLLTAIVLTILSFGLVISGQIGGEFTPKEDKGEFSVSFKTAPGSTLEYTAAKSAEVEALLRQIPEVTSISSQIGAAGFGNSKNNSEISVDIGNKRDRKRSLFEIMDKVRADLAPVAGIEVTSIEALGQSGPGGKPISIGLRGNNIQELEVIANNLLEELKKIEGVSDMESSLSDADPAVNIVLNREAAASLGIDLANVGQTIQTLLAGSTATTWEAPDGNNYDVVLRIPKNERKDHLLQEITIPATNSEGTFMVPLASIATIEETTVPRQIDRVDLQREITLTGNVNGANNSAIFAQIDALQANTALPPSVSFIQRGESQDMAESVGYAINALLMGIIFIYLILAAQFRSFTLPVTIMMSLPLVFIGVFVALWLSGNTLNMFSVIGIVLLMGLASKNGILLVDFINQARSEGMNREDAIAEAGRVRLRPILMTSLAMIFGMLPMVLGGGDGSESREPMAYAVIGGLITSTLLTLIVVPVVYTLFDSLRVWLHKMLHKLNGSYQEIEKP